MATVSESVARPVRGLGQGITGGVIVDALDEFTKWEPTTRQYGLAVILVGAIVSFVQNLGENRGWWKAVLRTVPPTEAEVVDEIPDPDEPKPAGLPADYFPPGDDIDSEAVNDEGAP